MGIFSKDAASRLLDDIEANNPEQPISASQRSFFTSLPDHAKQLNMNLLHFTDEAGPCFRLHNMGEEREDFRLSDDIDAMTDRLYSLLTRAMGLGLPLRTA